jgi:hypothetical protein
MIEIIGYIALIVGSTSFLIPSDKIFKYLQAATGILFGIKFYFNDLLLGSVSIIIGSTFLILSLLYDSKYLKYIITTIYTLLLLYAFYTYNHDKWFDILPAISNMLWIFAMFACKNQQTNKALIPVVLCWVGYTYATHEVLSFYYQFVVLTVLSYRIYIFSKNNNTLKTQPI